MSKLSERIPGSRQDTEEDLAHIRHEHPGGSAGCFFLFLSVTPPFSEDILPRQGSREWTRTRREGGGVM